MDSFWLWFWRPFGEAAGSIVLTAVVFAILLGPIWVGDFLRRRRRRRDIASAIRARSEREG